MQLKLIALLIAGIALADSKTGSGMEIVKYGKQKDSNGYEEQDKEQPHVVCRVDVQSGINIAARPSVNGDEDEDEGNLTAQGFRVVLGEELVTGSSNTKVLVECNIMDLYYGTPVGFKFQNTLGGRPEFALYTRPGSMVYAFGAGFMPGPETAMTRVVGPSAQVGYDLSQENGFAVFAVYTPSTELFFPFVAMKFADSHYLKHLARINIACSSHDDRSVDLALSSALHGDRRVSEMAFLAQLPLSTYLCKIGFAIGCKGYGQMTGSRHKAILSVSHPLTEQITVKVNAEHKSGRILGCGELSVQLRKDLCIAWQIGCTHDNDSGITGTTGLSVKCGLVNYDKGLCKLPEDTTRSAVNEILDSVL